MTMLLLGSNGNHNIHTTTTTTTPTSSTGSRMVPTRPSLSPQERPSLSQGRPSLHAQGKSASLRHVGSSDCGSSQEPTTKSSSSSPSPSSSPPRKQPRPGLPTQKSHSLRNVMTQEHQQHKATLPIVRPGLVRGNSHKRLGKMKQRAQQQNRRTMMQKAHSAPNLFANKNVHSVWDIELLSDDSSSEEDDSDHTEDDHHEDDSNEDSNKSNHSAPPRLMGTTNTILPEPPQPLAWDSFQKPASSHMPRLSSRVTNGSNSIRSSSGKLEKEKRPASRPALQKTDSALSLKMPKLPSRLSDPSLTNGSKSTLSSSNGKLEDEMKEKMPPSRPALQKTDSTSSLKMPKLPSRLSDPSLIDSENNAKLSGKQRYRRAQRTTSGSGLGNLPQGTNPPGSTPKQPSSSRRQSPVGRHAPERTSSSSSNTMPRLPSRRNSRDFDDQAHATTASRRSEFQRAFSSPTLPTMPRRLPSFDDKKWSDEDSDHDELFAPTNHGVHRSSRSTAVNVRQTNNPTTLKPKRHPKNTKKSKQQCRSMSPQRSPRRTRTDPRSSNKSDLSAFFKAAMTGSTTARDSKPEIIKFQNQDDLRHLKKAHSDTSLTGMLGDITGGSDEEEEDDETKCFAPPPGMVHRRQSADVLVHNCSTRPPMSPRRRNMTRGNSSSALLVPKHKDTAGSNPTRRRSLRKQRPRRAQSAATATAMNDVNPPTTDRKLNFRDLIRALDTESNDHLTLFTTDDDEDHRQDDKPARPASACSSRRSSLGSAHSEKSHQRKGNSSITTLLSYGSNNAPLVLDETNGGANKSPSMSDLVDQLDSYENGSYVIFCGNKDDVRNLKHGTLLDADSDSDSNDNATYISNGGRSTGGLEGEHESSMEELDHDDCCLR